MMSICHSYSDRQGFVLEFLSFDIDKGNPEPTGAQRLFELCRVQAGAGDGSGRPGAGRNIVADTEILGAPNTNRTCDLPLRRGLLYPLSYRGDAGILAQDNRRLPRIVENRPLDLR